MKLTNNKTIILIKKDDKVYSEIITFTKSGVLSAKEQDRLNKKYPFPHSRITLDCFLEKHGAEIGHLIGIL